MPPVPGTRRQAAGGASPHRLMGAEAVTVVALAVPLLLPLAGSSEWGCGVEGTPAGFGTGDQQHVFAIGQRRPLQHFWYAGP